jgi:hypothetical protein
MFRRIIAIVVVGLLLVVAENAVAQRIQGAIIAGGNLSQVDGDEIFGFNKLGFNAGLAAVVPFGDHIQLSIETLYSQKGSYQGKQYEDVDSAGNVTTGEYKVNLDYLEVPILIMYNDKDIITGGVGFSYGRLVRVREYEHGQRIETTTLNDGPYEKNDFSILADIRFRVYKKLKLNIRYAYSLAQIRTREFENLLGDTWTRKQYNNTLSFRLIYMFNEPQRIVTDPD